MAQRAKLMQPSDNAAGLRLSTKDIKRRKSRTLVGQVFGMLKVIARGDMRRSPAGREESTWVCACDCGGQRTVIRQLLVCGNATSCGCMSAERRGAKWRTHGLSRTCAEYIVWQAMRHRCSMPINPDWKNYGQRGIRVCDRWSKFENFLADMGRKPSPQHSIDRINTNGNYEPGNCRWATTREQARNKRNNRILEHNGERLCVAEWAEKTNLPSYLIFRRLAIGWSVQKTLSAPHHKLGVRMARKNQ